MKGKHRFLKTTAVVTLVIFVSKALGFLREIIAANYFGTGMENDAYVSAYSLFYLPILLFNSCITSTMVPMCISARKELGRRGEERFASNAVNMFAVAALVVSAIMFVLAEPLVKLIYYGFDGEKTHLTAQLLRVMLLTMAFNITSISLSSLLNAREQYVAAQLTGFPLSFALIFAATVFSQKYGIMAMAWGVFAASILQTLLLIPFLRGRFSYRAVLDFKDKRLHRLLVLAGPAILSMAVSELNHMVDNALASGLNKGDISALSYAYKLITFLIGVLIVPLTTITFSRMSKMVAEKNQEGILNILHKSIKLVALVMAPVVVVGGVLSRDVVRFAYGRGSFDEHSIAVTGGVLLFYVLGVIGFGLRDLLNRAFHSMQDTKTPFRVACAAVAMNIALNFILRELMGVNGLALATTISGTSAMLLLLWCLKKKMGHIGMKKLLPELGKIAVSAVAGLAVCFVISVLVPESIGMWGTLLRLVITTLGTFAAYLISCLLLREEIVSGLLNRGKKEDE